MTSAFYPTSLFSAIRTLKEKLPLIKQLVRRDVVGRYRGSMFGVVWSFLNPLLMLAIYSFVFTVVFEAKWGQGAQNVPAGKGSYAVILFCGLILHSFFAECLTRSPTAVTSNPNFVKKVVFPLEILAPSIVGSALFHLMVSMGVMFAAYVLVFHTVQWTLIFLPVVLVPFILLTIGIAWLFASLGVYLRDIGQVIGVLATILLFMSPILFPVSSLPPAIQCFIYLNPLSFIVETIRQVVIWGKMPHWQGLGLYSIASLSVFWLGFFWFQRTRRGFADVL